MSTGAKAGIIIWVIIMSYMLNMGLWGRIFAVPAELVSDAKLRMCGEIQLKALIYMLREGCADAAGMAAALRKYSETDIQDALDYWKAEGLIIEEGEAPPVAAIAGNGVQTGKEVRASREEPPHGGQPAAETRAAPEKALRPLSSPPVRLTAKEMDRLAAKPEIKSMLMAAESILGKTFTSTDTSTLLWLISWAGAPPDMLLTVIAYCAEIGKKRMSYIQATAVAWINDGIETAAQAESYIKELQTGRSYEYKVRSAFGIYDRAFTAREKKLVSEWQAAGFDSPLLTAAYDRSIEAIGKLSFSYINKILLSWRERGITTPEQAEQERLAQRESRKLEKSYDIGDIERLFADDINGIKD